MMRAIDRVLVSVVTDAFLLARFCGPHSGRPTGRAWERAVSQQLWRPGLRRRQHAGMLGVFGRGSASGAKHELDGVGQGHELAIWIESKACSALDKSYAATFHVKCFDLYRGAASVEPAATAAAEWWPILVSSEPAGDSTRSVCCDLGIVLCDPQCLPVPALLYAAGKPNADEYLPETELGELVRLGERACISMQERWRIDPETRTVVMSLDVLTPTEVADLLFLQDSLTEDFLDAMELHAPGYLERRAAALGSRLRVSEAAS